jgi:hypothetical protein
MEQAGMNGDISLMPAQMKNLEDQFACLTSLLQLEINQLSQSEKNQ